MKQLQSAITNPATYLESAGKIDKHSLATVFQERGGGSVLRLCLWR